jgi:hypothetical protein
VFLKPDYFLNAVNWLYFLMITENKLFVAETEFLCDLQLGKHRFSIVAGLRTKDEVVQKLISCSSPKIILKISV